MTSLPGSGFSLTCPVDKRRHDWVLLGFGMGLLVIRAGLAAHLGLAPDEAYYTAWAHHLALSYADHPPAIAWCIRMGIALFGENPLGVRALILIFGVLTPFLLYDAGRNLHGDHARARDTALAAMLVPLGFAGFVLATPDAPLALGWSSALAGALRLKRGQRGGILLLAFGITLAAYAKFIGWVLPFLLGLWLAGCPHSERKRLFRPFLLALFIAFIAWMPSFHALHAQEWTALRFQFNHGLQSTGGGFFAAMELLIAQAGLVGPGLFVIGIIWLVRFIASWMNAATRITMPFFRRENPSSRGGPKASNDDFRGLPTSEGASCTSLLFFLSAPIFVFFLFAALRSKPEANWPAVGWLPLLVAVDWTKLGPRTKFWSLWGAGFMTLLIILQAAFGWLTLREPTGQCYGWDELAKAVSKELDEKTVILLTDRYQEAASLRFELARLGKLSSNKHDKNALKGGLRHVGALPGRGRIDQYDLWPAPIIYPGESMLWLNRAGAGSAPPLEGFRQRRFLGRYHVGRKGQTRIYDLYRLEDALTKRELIFQDSSGMTR